MSSHPPQLLSFTLPTSQPLFPIHRDLSQYYLDYIQHLHTTLTAIVFDQHISTNYDPTLPSSTQPSHQLFVSPVSPAHFSPINHYQCKINGLPFSRFFSSVSSSPTYPRSSSNSPTQNSTNKSLDLLTLSEIDLLTNVTLELTIPHPPTTHIPGDFVFLIDPTVVSTGTASTSSSERPIFPHNSTLSTSTPTPPSSHHQTLNAIWLDLFQPTPSTLHRSDPPNNNTATHNGTPKSFLASIQSSFYHTLTSSPHHMSLLQPRQHMMLHNITTPVFTPNTTKSQRQKGALKTPSKSSPSPSSLHAYIQSLTPLPTPFQILFPFAFSPLFDAPSQPTSFPTLSSLPPLHPPHIQCPSPQLYPQYCDDTSDHKSQLPTQHSSYLSNYLSSPLFSTLLSAKPSVQTPLAMAVTQCFKFNQGRTVVEQMVLSVDLPLIFAAVWFSNSFSSDGDNNSNISNNNNNNNDNNHKTANFTNAHNPKPLQNSPNALLLALFNRFPQLEPHFTPHLIDSPPIIQLYGTKYNCTVNNRCLLALYKSSIQFHQNMANWELIYLRSLLELSSTLTSTTPLNNNHTLSALLHFFTNPSNSLQLNNHFDQLKTYLAQNSSPTLLQTALNFGLGSFFTRTIDQLDTFCTNALELLNSQSLDQLFVETSSTLCLDPLNDDNFLDYSYHDSSPRNPHSSNRNQLLPQLFHSIEHPYLLFHPSNAASVRNLIYYITSHKTTSRQHQLKASSLPPERSQNSRINPLLDPPLSPSLSIHQISTSSPPIFPTLTPITIPPHLLSYFNFHNFNPSQRAAIINALLSPYSSIFGPPGTGKTHTISHITALYFIANTTQLHLDLSQHTNRPPSRTSTSTKSNKQTKQHSTSPTSQFSSTPQTSLLNEKADTLQPRRLFLTGHSHSSVDQMMSTVVKTIDKLAKFTSFQQTDPGSITPTDLPGLTVPFLNAEKGQFPPNNSMNTIPLTIVRIGLQDQFFDLKDVARRANKGLSGNDNDSNQMQSLISTLSLSNHIRNNSAINPYAAACTIMTLVSQYTQLLKRWNSTTFDFTLDSFTLFSTIQHHNQAQSQQNSQNIPTSPITSNITSQFAFQALNDIHLVNSFCKSSHIFGPLWHSYNQTAYTFDEVVNDIIDLQIEKQNTTPKTPNSPSQPSRIPLLWYFLSNFFQTLHVILSTTLQYAFPIPTHIHSTQATQIQSLISTFQDKLTPLVKCIEKLVDDLSDMTSQANTSQVHLSFSTQPLINSMSGLNSLNVLTTFLQKFFNHAATITILRRADIICGTLASIGRLYYPLYYSLEDEWVEMETTNSNNSNQNSTSNNTINTGNNTATNTSSSSSNKNITNNTKFQAHIDSLIAKSKSLSKSSTQPKAEKRPDLLVVNPGQITKLTKSDTDMGQNTPQHNEFSNSYDISLFDSEVDFDDEYGGNNGHFDFFGDLDQDYNRTADDDGFVPDPSFAGGLLNNVQTMTDDEEVLDLINSVDNLLSDLSLSRLDSIHSQTPHQSYLPISSLLFPIVTFSMVILDEASQTPTPMLSLPFSILSPSLSISPSNPSTTSLSYYTLLNILLNDPARSANLNLQVLSPKIVFVGDPNQLPPTVIDPLNFHVQANVSILECISGQISSPTPRQHRLLLDTSLSLQDHPHNQHFSMLDVQYRMHPSIAKIISALFYTNLLTSPQDHQAKHIIQQLFSTQLQHNQSGQLIDWRSAMGSLASQYSLTPVPPSFLTFHRYNSYSHAHEAGVNGNGSSTNLRTQLLPQFTSTILPMQLLHHSSIHSTDARLQSHFNTKEARLIAKAVCVAISSSVFTTTMLLTQLIINSANHFFPTNTIQSQFWTEFRLVLQRTQSLMYDIYFHSSRSLKSTQPPHNHHKANLAQTRTQIKQAKLTRNESPPPFRSKAQRKREEQAKQCDGLGNQHGGLEEIQEGVTNLNIGSGSLEAGINKETASKGCTDPNSDQPAPQPSDPTPFNSPTHVQINSSTHFHSTEHLSSTILHLLSTIITFTTSTNQTIEAVIAVAQFIIHAFLTPASKISIISMYNAQIPIIQAELVSHQYLLQDDQFLHLLLVLLDILLTTLNFITLPIHSAPIIQQELHHDALSTIFTTIMQLSCSLEHNARLYSQCQWDELNVSFSSPSFHASLSSMSASLASYAIPRINSNSFTNLVQTTSTTPAANSSKSAKSKADSESRSFAIPILTVDSSQGTENDIIFVSTVRNSGPIQKHTKASLGFMDDPNRINVALSRAKRCVVIFGNAALLGGHIKSIQKSITAGKFSKYRGELDFLYTMQRIKRRHALGSVKKQTFSLSSRDRSFATMKHAMWKRIVMILLFHNNVLDAEEFFDAILTPQSSSSIYLSPSMSL